MNQSPVEAQLESVAGSLPSGAQEDFRQLMQTVIGQVLSISPGGSWLRAGGPPKNSSTVPQNVAVQVAAANGQFTLALSSKSPNPSATTVYYEVSYSATKGFTSGVTTLPPNAGSSVTLALSNATYFFRVRASYDLQNWSAYSLAANSAASSGLIQSAAISNGGAFNQTNFMTVDSVAVNGSAQARIYGVGGPLTSGVAQKGSTQKALPSATIVNVTPASKQFVGWDGGQYHIKPTLASVLADDLTPIGAVDVVTTAAPTLPTIKAVVSSGAIIAYNVTNGGAGATSDYTLTIADTGSGAGATTGPQTFDSGVLVSVAPGNPGANYGSGTTVTASGGQSAGTPGGGTITGGNGGRLTAV